ncbi:hypothetical protein P9314_08595 [Paenibacillus validus]|uniref:hypothetical protein n=1 Tax=Paenibacillus validus TaxID=44253 RepID=UPI002E242718|nr:hypothetical protein [Paenibacillus validus]MED4606167.1 hypothetical protein [Paenibacillus validus]
MNRTKIYFYNSSTAAFYQLILVITGFILPRVMLEYYGSEINGLVSSINQFIVYFNLVEAGLSSAVIYTLYRPLADKNYKAINAIVVAAKKFYTLSGYIFISLTLGLSLIYPLHIKLDSLSPLSVGLLILILGVNGALEFFTLAKYRVILTADQKTYVVSLASIVNIVVSTLIITSLAMHQVSIVIIYFVALLSIFLRSFILMGYVKLKYKYLDYNEKPNFSALNKRWDALYLQVLGAIHKGAPIVILTIVTGNLKLVSVYTIFNIVITGINGLSSIFISGLSASFGDIIARKEEQKLQKVYSEFEFIYYCLITIIYAVAFITIMPFIKIYTSGINDINYYLPFIGFLFVLNDLLYNIKTPQGMLVISAGMFKETKLQTTIQGAIAVILGIILTPHFGIVGVLLGSILSNLYRDIDLMFFIPKKLTKLPVKQTAYRIIRIFTTISIIYLPFVFIKINPVSYASWFSFAFIIFIFAVLIVLIISLIFERVYVMSSVNRIISILKR